MADYLVLKRPTGETSTEAWKVIAVQDGLSADAAGAAEAVRLSYSGPGQYGALRADQGKTADVTEEPVISPHSTPQF